MVSAFILLLLVLDPLAVPLLAGPSAMATVLLASRQPDKLASWVGALTAAMAVSGTVLMLCDHIRRWVGDSVTRWSPPPRS